MLKPYLERIGLDLPLAADAESLRRLQMAHLLHVPFENLDIALGRPIRLGLTTLYDKIVTHRRGGFCYELNGLFAWLLDDLGFEVTYLFLKMSSRVDSRHFCTVPIVEIRRRRFALTHHTLCVSPARNSSWGDN